MKKFILTLIVILTLIPLFRPGLFDVHDPTSIIRFFTLHETIASGQFPGAWTNLLNHGFGYPLFLYYAPVFTYLGVLIKLLVPSYLIALKLSLGLMVGLAALGMYKLMRSNTGSASALVASIAYTTLPYHASTLYVRGSYAEGMTWAILPWLLYMWSRGERDKHWIALTSVTTALFFMSHNSLPFVFIPFLLVWIIMHIVKNLRPTIIALLLGVGLSLWFLLPVLFERGLTQIDRIATSTAYSDHFLRPAQLWHSPWGYGGSAGLSETDGMSFMLGKFQLVLAGLAILFVGLSKKWNKYILFYISMLIFYVFMATTFAAPVWGVVEGLSILQFPWRLLAFASFGLAALSAYGVEYNPRKFRIIAASLAVIGLAYFNLKFFVPQSYIPYKDQDLLSQEKLDTVARDKIPEYLPSSMPLFLSQSIDDGFVRTPTKVYGDFANDTARPLMISTAYMPQWLLQVDGKDVAIEPTSIGSIVSDPVEVGQHTLSLTWHPTLIENIGLFVSAATLLIVIGLLFI